MRTSPSMRRIETWNFICSRVASSLPLVLLAVGQPAYPRGIYESKHGALIRFPPANARLKASALKALRSAKKAPARKRPVNRLFDFSRQSLITSDDETIWWRSSGLLETCGGGDGGNHLRKELARRLVTADFAYVIGRSFYYRESVNQVESSSNVIIGKRLWTRKRIALILDNHK